MNLYQLSARYQQLFNQPCLSGEDLAELDSLSDSIEDKLIEIAKHAKNKQTELSAVSDSVVAMVQRTKKLSEEIDLLNQKMVILMEIANIRCVTKSPLFEIRIANNPPRLMVDDETVIPNQYRQELMMLETKIDTKKIKEDLKNGIKIPGCYLEQNKRIKIS